MALLYKQLSPLHGVWKMEESSDELLGMLEHKADYSSFLERVSAEKRRQEHFASRVLLKELLGEEVRVDYHSTGAPFLACVPLYISISHTKDYVAVILDKRPTGIDTRLFLRIHKATSYFQDPVRTILDIDLEHEVEHLLIHWCAKETLFKIIGQEGVDFQKHLHVNPFPYLSSGTFKGRETRTEACREYELAYQVTPDYVLTWLK